MCAWNLAVNFRPFHSCPIQIAVEHAVKDLLEAEFLTQLVQREAARRREAT